ncbi:MAG: hypothetical protein ACOX6V_01185 [Patescibacteria group bacterium]|jgi:hypothetical protein
MARYLETKLPEIPITDEQVDLIPEEIVEVLFSGDVNKLKLLGLTRGVADIITICLVNNRLPPGYNNWPEFLDSLCSPFLSEEDL